MSSFNFASYLKLKNYANPDKEEDECNSICTVRDDIWFSSNNGILGVLTVGRGIEYVSSYNTDEFSDRRCVVVNYKNPSVGLMSSFYGHYYIYDLRLKIGMKIKGYAGRDIYSLSFPVLLNPNILCTGCSDNYTYFWDLRNIRKPIVEFKTPCPWEINWFGLDEPMGCFSSIRNGANVLKFNKNLESYSRVYRFGDDPQYIHYTDVLPNMDNKKSPYFCSLSYFRHKMNVWRIPDYK